MPPEQHRAGYAMLPRNSAAFVFLGSFPYLAAAAWTKPSSQS
jgi:hypothetical protein